MRLEWSSSASADMARIYDHYAAFHPDIGLRMTHAIRDAAERLAEFPLSAPAVAAGLRKLSVQKIGFVLLFRVSGDQVRILRIRHMRENWQPS